MSPGCDQQVLALQRLGEEEKGLPTPNSCDVCFLYLHEYFPQELAESLSTELEALKAYVCLVVCLAFAPLAA